MLLVISLIALVTYKVVRLAYYVNLAKGTALPYTITPFLETETASLLLLNPLLRRIYHSHLDRGEGWPRWCRFFIKDWSWEDKRRAHDELGDVFLCVSPEGIICYSAEAAMGLDVMNRRSDFTKPRDKYKILEPYGPNVVTAEGKTYQFHLRITAPPFSDISGVNSLVWRETTAQTKCLIDAWLQAPQGIQRDVNSLTLAVISLAGFGKRLDWKSTAQTEDESSFLSAISDTVRYIVLILIIPRWVLMLTPWKRAAVAQFQLEQHLRGIIRDQRTKLAKDINHTDAYSRGNLLTAIVRASIVLESESNGPSQPKGFNDEETMGNVFIYLLAGYETTANAIIYGLIALAIHQDIQDNVIAEIDQVYEHAKDSGSRTELTYEDDFERLEYTYGFMYETLRLFPGVTLITKVATNPQHITTNSKPYLLPAGTRVYLSAPGIHYHPKYWPDPEKLDPHRWINTDNSGKRVTAADRNRQMRGTFLGFSDGGRACLGRKFAQAEYIAFFATLLRRCRVELAPGVDAAIIKRDLYGKSGGSITLTPLGNVPLRIRAR
ncbi:cytochrome P450 [Aspergillus stella-maris]|uniref:cytochrome P450 n=1 Tax=Aspergillus stella-maris TaxID=1810926 RepID=UPI003CCD6309